MSDIFTLNTIHLTPELGMTFKNYRIENNITAKSLTIKFEKSSSYITKLEKGIIKKIDSSLFIQMCNYISGSENGLIDFLNKASQSYASYSAETKLSITNIDDLLVEHSIPSDFIDTIKKYLTSHNISLAELTDKINSNRSVCNYAGYEGAPSNEWYVYNNDYDNIFIKLAIPQTYIDDLLTGKLLTIHIVIAEAILYSMYSFSADDDKARKLANSKLALYHILRIRGGNIVHVSDSNFEELFGNIEPEVADSLKGITSGLKLIATISKKDGYGASRLKQINSNLKQDLGFGFAYMSTDLTTLEKKSKEKKQEFLNDLKKLIQKYSSDSDGIDFYE